MIDAAIPDQTQWLQLYVNANRALTKKLIEKAESRGVKALFITVDAPQLGRREKDMRMKFDDPGSKVQEKNVVERGQGAARAISSFIDSSLSWEDLAWFKTVTKLPILLKGVQCYEVGCRSSGGVFARCVTELFAFPQDVLLAIKAGMQGVVLSNHGGRQLVSTHRYLSCTPQSIHLDDHNLRNSLDPVSKFSSRSSRSSSNVKCGPYPTLRS